MGLESHAGFAFSFLVGIGVGRMGEQFDGLVEGFEEQSPPVPLAFLVDRVGDFVAVGEESFGSVADIGVKFDVGIVPGDDG